MSQDLLIAHGWQQLIQCLSMLMFLSTVSLVGFLIRELENALFFTLSTSAVIFSLFLLT